MSETAPAFDRRRRRRQETIDEILGIAIELMARDGVAGLSLAEVARRMGMQPPSLYKYFDSKTAVYDALFLRGAEQTLQVFRTAEAQHAPGMATIRAGTEAVVRLALEHPVLSQLQAWRPVPGFEPSPEAFAPSVEFIEAIREHVRVAVRRREVGPEADSDDAIALLSVLATGLMSQQMANEPDATFERGRFTRLTAKVIDLFVAAYPPKRSAR